MANDGNIVNLNVGGVLYSTTRTTLCKYPETMIGGNMEATIDENGCYFIDRNGKLFEYILDFLRSSELAVPKDFKGLKQLRLEAIFYRIMPLVQIIDGLLVPKQSEYFFIEHTCHRKISQFSNGYTEKSKCAILRGKAEFIKKYFERFIKSGQQLNTTYDTLTVIADTAYHPMTYGEALRQDGWKLVGSTSTALADFKTVINKDTWCLEM